MTTLHNIGAPQCIPLSANQNLVAPASLTKTARTFIMILCKQCHPLLTNNLIRLKVLMPETKRIIVILNP